MASRRDRSEWLFIHVNDDGPLDAFDVVTCPCNSTGNFPTSYIYTIFLRPRARRGGYKKDCKHINQLLRLEK